MNNEQETIDGVKGEWRTVTKPSEVTVGQRVRYEDRVFHSYSGYGNIRLISKKNKDKTCSTWDGVKPNSGTDYLFYKGHWTNIQAFFPLPAKRKVAKVKIYPSSKYFFETKVAGLQVVSEYYSKRSHAIRGARRFCKAIGYECEIVK
jgi:hypothetical protein